MEFGSVTLGMVRRFTSILGITVSSQAVNTVLIPSPDVVFSGVSATEGDAGSGVFMVKSVVSRLDTA